jgi:hypothetical protein
MAIINSYPKGTPKAEDLLLGTDVPQEYSGKEGITKNFKITDIANLVISQTGANTGSGTTDFVTKFTDGPNGVIGDSLIKSYTFAPGTGGEEARVECSGVVISTTGRFSNIETDQILASDSGLVRLYGNVNIGNASADELTIASTTNIFNAPVKSGPTLFGALAPGADYVLASTVSSTLNWTSQDDYVSGAMVKLIPFQITASAGGSDDYDRPNNIVELGWTGGNGTYVLNIPSATDIPYRNIRFVTNSTFPNGASDKVQITAQSGETIDGAAFFEISKQYEGVSLWSNGTEWIVIQAKAH